MAETVTISRDELFRLLEMEGIQEDERSVGELTKLHIEKAVLRQLGAKWQTVSDLGLMDSLSNGELAEVARAAVWSRTLSDYSAVSGDYDVTGEQVGADYSANKVNNYKKPADLSPLGLGSVYGKILLELARRLELAGDRAAVQRERSEVVLDE